MTGSTLKSLIVDLNDMMSKYVLYYFFYVLNGEIVKFR